MILPRVLDVVLQKLAATPYTPEVMYVCPKQPALFNMNISIFYYLNGSL